MSRERRIAIDDAVRIARAVAEGDLTEDEALAVIDELATDDDR